MITTRCFRHTRWIASCSDCTAWHLAHQRRRCATAAASHPGRAAVTGHRARTDAVLDVYLPVPDARRRDIDQLPTFSTVSVPAASSLT